MKYGSLATHSVPKSKKVLPKRRDDVVMSDSDEDFQMNSDNPGPGKKGAEVSIVHKIYQDKNSPLHLGEKEEGKVQVTRRS
jgi:hypothetical protein